jgi:multidrug resistance efflux pump
MNVTELERMHIGQRAKVTFPESGTKDSFTGVIVSVSHTGDQETGSSTANFKVGGHMIMVISLADSVVGPATITLLGD